MPKTAGSENEEETKPRVEI